MRVGLRLLGFLRNPQDGMEDGVLTSSSIKTAQKSEIIEELIPPSWPSSMEDGAKNASAVFHGRRHFSIPKEIPPARRYLLTRPR